MINSYNEFLEESQKQEKGFTRYVTYTDENKKIHVSCNGAIFDDVSSVGFAYLNNLITNNQAEKLVSKFKGNWYEFCNNFCDGVEG